MKKLNPYNLQFTKSKHEYEFQEVCSELEPYFGKGVWTVAHMKGVTEYKMKEAFKIARKRGKARKDVSDQERRLNLSYFIGIVRTLP